MKAKGALMTIALGLATLAAWEVLVRPQLRNQGLL